MSQITLTELYNIKGIGKKTIELIRQYMYKRDYAKYSPPESVIKLSPNNSYLGDCLDLMWGIPDGTIDMILADLPYGTTACAWDTIIPFEPLWQHYKRIIKDSGVIVLTSTQPFTTELIKSEFELFKYCWYWVKSKPNGWQHSKNKPMRSVEEICVFSKAGMGHVSQLGDKRMEYNPQGVEDVGVQTVKSYWHGNTIGARPNQIGKKYIAQTGFPNDILEFPNVIGKKATHPTQKPIALFEYLIKTYTNEGDLVLDNVAGSFTTAIAALNTNRKYICIEKELEYFDLGQKRIQEWHTVNP